MSRFRGLERRITEVRCHAKRTPTKFLGVRFRSNRGRTAKGNRPPAHVPGVSGVFHRESLHRDYLSSRFCASLPGSRLTRRSALPRPPLATRRIRLDASLA